MSDPIIFTGLTLDQANATAEYHARLGASVSVTGDGTGLFKVEADYPSVGAGQGTPNGGGGAAGGGPGAGGGSSDDDGGDPPAASDQIAWGKKVSQGFKTKVITICGVLGCDPSHLMAAMAFETGERFSPTIQNPRSGATGLIQFMPTTAASLGTSIAALLQMTAVQQLDYVQKYLSPYKGRMRSLSDVYMTILYPVAVGKPDSHVLFAAPSTAYQQNRGLDVNGDGEVTKGEAASKVQARLDEGLSSINRG
jgi:hypothetical protein